MRIRAGLPTGVTGVLFEEALERRQFEAWLVAELEAAGYSEVILPILDYFEPYEPLLTAASQDELYRFIDRDGDLLVLRADFTPLLARLIAPRLHMLELPLRLFYRGDVVRHQQVRPGRPREYYNVGAELLGGDRDVADGEVLALFVRLLAAAGPRRMRVVLGFAGALDGLLQSANSSRAGLAEAITRRDRGRARAASPALLEVVEQGVPEDLGALGDEAARRLEALGATAEKVRLQIAESSETELDVSIDLAEFATNTLSPELEVPGSKWTYYDGIVFRAYEVEEGREVGRGGRYDLLFRTLGAEVPAVGFSFGLDGLLERRHNRRGEAP